MIKFSILLSVDWLHELTSCGLSLNYLWIIWCLWSVQGISWQTMYGQSLYPEHGHTQIRFVHLQQSGWEMQQTEPKQGLACVIFEGVWGKIGHYLEGKHKVSKVMEQTCTAAQELSGCWGNDKRMITQYPWQERTWREKNLKKFLMYFFYAHLKLHKTLKRESALKILIHRILQSDGFYCE